MITQLDDLPDGVIGFSYSGEVHAADYESVMFPVVDAAAKAGPLRIVVVFEDFRKMSSGASWEDLKMGTEHLRGWKRIAVVTDLDWMDHLVAVFGWMSPGKVRTFPLAEREQAVAWVAADD
ncbi:SpoIIAA family protein [Dermatobacter hominis]|uniref:STAS/SEC14 domain-containing protein n=1 Tax=Dermatobacter hominis TaxID=2884263 RepID=UPI001D0FC65B|nr:STAS/SEC14 domain-containing protein [Dermatobacter hominis]UDY34481.1 STAS/SEC14 domain-containing protein [Dermatobacter hominis]